MIHYILVLALILQGASSKNFWEYDSPEEQDSSEFGVDPGAKGTTCPCGWANKLAGRIVGGKETMINEYPLIAALYHTVKKVLYCGGTILTKRHVLTAAHCTKYHNVSHLKVVVGEHDLRKERESNTVMIQVESKTEHEKYNSRRYNNDIAVVYLSSDIPFSQEVGPVCLPTEPVDLIGKYVKIIGWGKEDDTDELGSKVLMKVNTIVINGENCVKMFPKSNIDVNKQMCTFRHDKDSCVGDSGGPLLWLDPETNRFTQVGLVSFGKACASFGFPSINTNVFAYIPWIKEKLTGAGDFQLCTKQA